MFDSALNTPLNKIKNFFPDVSKLKSMIFDFFSNINFSYQYLPEDKVYLEPSRTFYNGVFGHFIFLFFAKFTRKHLCRNLVLTKLQVSILQLHWKKGLPHRTPPGDLFCTMGKYFTNKIEQNVLWEKQWHTHNKNVITIYISSSYPFTIQKCICFSFLSFPWYIENTSFRNNAIPLGIYLL